MGDKFVICKWCANNDETCSACGVCEKGEYFVPKGMDCASECGGCNCELNDMTDDCLPCNREQASPEKYIGYSHNRVLKPEERPGKKERGKILRKALDIINGERQDKYGSPEDSFALIAEYWNSYLIRLQKNRLKENGFDPKEYTLMDMIDGKGVAEMMMLFKLARMSGQKPSFDNYIDLVGYAGIAADMLEDN